MTWDPQLWYKCCHFSDVFSWPSSSQRSSFAPSQSGKIIISARGGGPPSLYLELPQVYCSVSGNIELGKNISDVLLVHLVVADGIQVFDHLLNVNKATVVTVNGIEQFLIINTIKILRLYIVLGKLFLILSRSVIHFLFKYDTAKKGNQWLLDWRFVYNPLVLFY